jgi:hypothetical protein
MFWVVYWIIMPLAAVEPSNSDRQSGFGRFSRIKLFESAKCESRKQSEEPESTRVQMFCRFSVSILINKAEGDQNEAALRWTRSNGADAFKEDALLSTGTSADEATSLGSLKTQLRKQSHCSVFPHQFHKGRRRGPSSVLFRMGIYQRSALWKHKSCIDCSFSDVPFPLEGACHRTREHLIGQVSWALR